MERRVPYLFAGYVLDPDRRELSHGSDKVAITPQAFDLLLHLVKNRDHVVSKDALLDAVWAGRIVSESTLASHINAVRKALGDSGDEQRLLKTVARKGFRFVGDVTETAMPAQSDAAVADHATSTANPNAALTLPDRPSIAVLPFLNLSGDPQQDYFVDGMVEDIILALSRLRWLFVIARNSSFTFKGRAVDVREVGRELGVRYVLEGSVRRVANRVRITGQLVDTTTGMHLWGERFESVVDDIFDLQDQVTESVVGAIAPQLEFAEIERAKRKPTESLDAYDYYLRGLANFHVSTRDGIDAALANFYKAIELDPDFAAAYGMAAGCFYWRKMNRWLSDRVADGHEAARLAERAVTLGKNDAVALTRGGHAWPHFGGDLHASSPMSIVRWCSIPISRRSGISGAINAFRLASTTRPSPIFHAPCGSVRSIPRHSRCIRESRCRISIRDASMSRWIACGRRRARCRTFSVLLHSRPLRMLWVGEWKRRVRRWAMCAGSILHYGSAILTTGCWCGDRRTSHLHRKACAKPAFRNEPA
jgi:TolB-like protein